MRAVVNWEGDAPTGGILHVAAVDERGLQITDVWESAEAFQAFVNDRLMPGVKQVGILGGPQVEILPLHALFAPGVPQG